MHIDQSLEHQNLIEAQSQFQQVGPGKSKLFWIVIMGVLLTALITGSTIYFWQKSANERAIRNLTQKVSSLERQISTLERTKTVIVPGQITDWRIYISSKYGYSFRYPPKMVSEPLQWI